MATLPHNLDLASAAPRPVRTGASDVLAVSIAVPLAATIGERFRRWLTAVAILDMSLQIDINLRYNDYYAALGAFGGFNLSLTTIALIGIYLSLTLESVTRPWEKRHIRCSRPALLFVAMSAASLLAARDLVLAGAELFLLSQMFLLYLYIASSTRSREQLRWLMAVLLVGALVQVGIFAGLVALGHSVVLPGFDARLDAYGPAGFRIGGSIGSPNNAGAFFAFMVLASIALFLYVQGNLFRILAMLTLIGGSACLVMTFSRGAWLSCAVGLLVLLAVHFRRHRRSMLTAGVATAVVIAALIAGSESVRTRLFSDDRGAAYARIPLMMIAGEVIADRPLTGVGMNNFPVVVGDYARTFAGEWVSSVHNKYLLVWAETGTLGFIAFIWFVGASLRRSWKLWRIQHRDISPFAAALFAGLTVLAVHMCFDIFRGRPVVQMLWVGAALVMALQNVIVPGMVARRDV